jgi:hypothetical protein
MPNDDDREMLTEVVALYLAAHMKAQAALTMALVAILIQKGVLSPRCIPIRATGSAALQCCGPRWLLRAGT